MLICRKRRHVFRNDAKPHKTDGMRKNASPVPSSGRVKVNGSPVY